MNESMLVIHSGSSSIEYALRGREGRTADDTHHLPRELPR